MTLGQGSAHGLVAIKKTKSHDYPNGLIYKLIAMLMKKNKPKEVSAETELGAKLEKIQFRMANDYYNLVVMVMARYEVDKSDMDLIKIMAKKVNSPMYAKMVIEHLNQTATQHDLEELCGEIS